MQLNLQTSNELLQPANLRFQFGDFKLLSFLMQAFHLLRPKADIILDAFLQTDFPLGLSSSILLLIFTGIDAVYLGKFIQILLFLIVIALLRVPPLRDFLSLGHLSLLMMGSGSEFVKLHLQFQAKLIFDGQQMFRALAFLQEIALLFAQFHVFLSKFGDI